MKKFVLGVLIFLIGTTGYGASTEYILNDVWDDANNGLKASITGDASLTSMDATEVDVSGLMNVSGDVYFHGAYRFPKTGGNDGDALTYGTGGDLSWTAAGGSPAGSDTQIQFNNSGSFGGATNFVWDGTNVGIGTSAPLTKFHVFHNASGGVAPSATLDYMALEDNNNAYIDLINGTSKIVGLIFSDDTFARGQLTYNFSADGMAFITTGAQQAYLNSVGLGIGIGTAREKLDVAGSIIASATIGVGTTAPSAAGMDVLSWGGIGIGADSTNNMFDDASNGAGTTTMYIGNTAITVAFTQRHYYQLGDLDLQPGELVVLKGKKIYRCKNQKDKRAIGIYWGVPNHKDSFGTVFTEDLGELEEYEIDEIESCKKTDPGAYQDPNGKDPNIAGWIRDIKVKKHRKRSKVFKKGTNKPATKADQAFSVAVAGDSIEEHTVNPLTGAYVTIDNGIIVNGDFLQASNKPGYLEKQDDDIRHNYTVAVAREDINEDRKDCYIYLLQ